MLQVRREMFETNSSSCHSISILNEDSLEFTSMNKPYQISGDQFGWSEIQYKGWENKLNYLYSLMMYCFTSCETIEDIKESIYFTLLNEMFEEYTGQKLEPVVFDEYSLVGYVDHQSEDIFDSILKLDLAKNRELIKFNMLQFVFNKKYAINTANDNSYIRFIPEGKRIRDWEKLQFAEYKNGNYNVKIYDNGTKVRSNDLDNLTPSFPESIDLKITNKCDIFCEYCHESSHSRGSHADINDLFELILQLKPHTELAIGGGDLFEFDELESLLLFCNYRQIIPNITVNVESLKSKANCKRLDEIIKKKLIKGLGISYNPIELNQFNGFATKEVAKDMLSQMKKYLKYEHTVIHVINTVNEIECLKLLFNKGLKLLILGYKNKGRALILNKKYDNSLQKHLPKLKKSFRVLSFDNLALQQLDIKTITSQEDYDKHYMGDDGEYTMYIDMVKKQYAVSSSSQKRYSINKDMNVQTMFDKIRKTKGK